MVQIAPRKYICRRVFSLALYQGRIQMSETLEKSRKDCPARTLVLFRHGEKTDPQQASAASGLTDKGREQVRSTARQLAQLFSPEQLQAAAILSSGVGRVVESAAISAEVIGANIERIQKFKALEWGPDHGTSKTMPAIELLLSQEAELAIALGHNGLWEQIAQLLCPRSGGYQMQTGEAYVISITGDQALLEIITPGC